VEVLPMDGKAYVKELSALEKMGKLFMCEYCGIETPALDDQCMCSNCESLVTSTRELLGKKDHVLVNTLDTINKSIDGHDYDAVIAMYERIVLERKEPSLMYAAAIAYLKYSNHEIAKIGYMSMGFMEENTAHRDKAAKLVSSAKKLLTKSISVANAEIANGNKPVNLVYNKFLCQIKMGSVRGSKETVGVLEKMGNEYVYKYAALVFEASRERYEKVLKLSEDFVKAKSFSLNVYYYIGLSLFKEGRMKDAKVVLESLKGILKSNNLEALIFEVDAQLRG
jgi:tetratricopeptide (TPR) repeat protein